MKQFGRLLALFFFLPFPYAAAAKIPAPLLQWAENRCWIDSVTAFFFACEPLRKEILAHAECPIKGTMSPQCAFVNMFRLMEESLKTGGHKVPASALKPFRDQVATTCDPETTKNAGRGGPVQTYWALQNRLFIDEFKNVFAVQKDSSTLLSNLALGDEPGEGVADLLTSTYGEVTHMGDYLLVITLLVPIPEHLDFRSIKGLSKKLLAEKTGWIYDCVGVLHAADPVHQIIYLKDTSTLDGKWFLWNDMSSEDIPTKIGKKTVAKIFDNTPKYWTLAMYKRRGKPGKPTPPSVEPKPKPVEPKPEPKPVQPKPVTSEEPSPELVTPLAQALAQLAQA